MFPSNPEWVLSLLIVVGAVFFLAAIIGPFVRNNSAADMPITESHYEDPSHPVHERG